MLGMPIMLTIRNGAERGHTNFGWLDSRHTFSFGEYFDQKHMQFRTLRVINDDLVAVGGGFPIYPHRDMEILNGEAESLPIHQDARVYQTRLVAGQTVTHSLRPGRAAYLHVAAGAVTVNDTPLTAGDGVAVEDEASVTVTGLDAGETLLFDLA